MVGHGYSKDAQTPSMVIILRDPHLIEKLEEVAGNTGQGADRVTEGVLLQCLNLGLLGDKGLCQKMYPADWGDA
tara:strand:+ start:218 stop:439 length:222 start_codon:yes stop_codon:yes gene_type:complete